MADAKVFIVYDERGRIKATAVPAHPQTRVQSSKDMRVHVIDHPGIGREKMRQYLLELHRDHRVNLIGEPRLVRKQPKN